jgi:4-hydroxybenzoate polyprenyltransferase
MKLRRLFAISRPRFWIYELGPYAVGVVAAAAHYHGLAWLTIPSAIFFLFFTYPANIYIYGINDAYDYETDRLNPKKVAYESLVLPEERRNLFWSIAFACAPFAVYAFFVASLPALIAFAAFFFFAGFYSAKPIRAKAKPFLDSIFSAGHYVATGVFSYILTANIVGAPISIRGISIAIIAGMFWAISMHAYSAVPDIKADHDGGLATIATRLKKRNTILLCAFLYTLSAIISFQSLGWLAIIMAAVYVLLMCASLDTTDEQLFAIYTYFPIINTMAGAGVFFVLLYK